MLSKSASSTQNQCKRACDESSDCYAILFNDTAGTCERRSSSTYDDCIELGLDSDATTSIFIDHLEHYYETPESSYVGSSTLFTTTTDFETDCQFICDSFLYCESIRFDVGSDANNCEILGDDYVDFGTGENVTNVKVARGTTLFTIALSNTNNLLPDSDAILTTVNNIFDLDECQALCQEHARCGAIQFAERTCILYKVTGFAAGVGNSSNVSIPYYVSYDLFVNVEQDFVEAVGLCVEDQDYATVPIETRGTVRSKYDCANRCDDDTECMLFTYDKASTSNCELYGSEARLTPCDFSATTTFVMYTRASIGSIDDADVWLKDEASLPLAEFTLKSLQECVS